MNKLTEIKQRIKVCQNITEEMMKCGPSRGEELDHKLSLVTSEYEVDVTHLLSLLEEKDKALKEIANYRHSYKYEFVYLGETDFALSDCSEIACNALNTSSNNEGE